jgi:hypothetical protein
VRDIVVVVVVVGGGVGVGVVVHCLVTALSAHKIVLVESLWDACTYQDIYSVVVVNLLF